MKMSCNLTDNSARSGNISITETLLDFERLRLSALTNAAEISPLVKEVTIGPKSPINKEEIIHEISKSRDPEANLIEDKLKEGLRYTLILKEYETKLQETSEELFKNLIEKMVLKRAETMRKYFKKQSEEHERRALECKARKLRMLRELQDNDNLSVLEKAKLDEQHSQMINRRTIENMNRILEEQNKATARFASLTDSHTKICISYNKITEMIQSDMYAKNAADKYVPAITTVMANINSIMDLCKTGAITDKDVKQAEVLHLNIENLQLKIVKDINEMKQNEIIEKQKQEEVQKMEEKRAEEAKAAELAQLQNVILEQSKKTSPRFYSIRNYRYYEELRCFLDDYETKYTDLLTNTNLKKFRFDCQKAINTPVNAISSVSGIHIKDKFDKLSKLLKGERVQVLDTFVTATQHPQGLFYCTALLAKKVVRQGDLLVSSNPEAAFPLAAVTVALWSQFPEFGKLLEAYFHKYCPYLVPMFLPQNEGQSDKDFYLSRGYTYNDEGVVEKQDKFLKRMSGIFRLRCAIWISKTPRFINAQNPHGLQFAWQWLSSFINLKPEPDISATLLLDFFTVCGSECFKCYGKQFTKIVKLISTDYIAILENIDEGGPKTRLEVFLQNVLNTGHISPPNGLLQPTIW